VCGPHYGNQDAGDENAILHGFGLIWLSASAALTRT
jgi:hypothetical protein